MFVISVLKLQIKTILNYRAKTVISNNLCNQINNIALLVFLLCYTSIGFYIFSTVNYYPLVCHCCGIQNSRNMDKIQERALRFIYEYHERTSDILL